jgi:transcriptional regulator
MPKPPTTRTDLLRGTLDLLILRSLSPRALHGVAIADRIAQVTQGTFDVQPGSLFPALHRLEQAGWTTGQWTTTEEGRRVRTYTLTAAGRRQLAEQENTWERVVTAVARVLRSA